MEKENIFLIVGSIFVAWFYSILQFLKIDVVQVLVLVSIFVISMIIGTFRTLSLKEDMRAFVCSDLLAKTLMLFIPFIFALESKVILPFEYFVDYSFAFLTLGEILTIMVSIQSIKNKTPYKGVDIYNLGLKKLQKIIIKTLKLGN